MNNIGQLIRQGLTAASKGTTLPDNEIARLPDVLAEAMREAVARVATLADDGDQVGANAEAKRSTVELFELAEAERWPPTMPLRPPPDDADKTDDEDGEDGEDPAELARKIRLY